MQYPQLPVISLLASVVVLVPLPWQWRARNVPIVAIIVWLCVMNIIYAVGAIVWAGNVNNVAPVWCDISTKINIGGSIALPLTNMCFAKNLKSATSRKLIRMDTDSMKQRMIFDSAMCFGVPMIFMVLHYIVQGHRFVIVENFGCEPDIYVSAPAVILIWVPQLLPSVLTMIYATLALYNIASRRRAFAAYMKVSDSALSTKQYIRLVVISLIIMSWGMAFSSLSTYIYLKPGLNPWISWAHVHQDFSPIYLLAAVESPSSARMRMVCWAGIPSGSFVFVVCFCWGEDAQKEYRNVWLAFRQHVVRQDVKRASMISVHSNQRPVHVNMVDLREDGEDKTASSLSLSQRPPSESASRPPASI